MDEKGRRHIPESAVAALLLMLLTACGSKTPNLPNIEGLTTPTPTSAPTLHLDTPPTATVIPPTPIPDTKPPAPPQNEPSNPTPENQSSTILKNLSPEQIQQLETLGTTVVRREMLKDFEWKPFSDYLANETPGWFIVGDWSTIPVTGALLASINSIGSSDITFVTWSQDSGGNPSGGVVITQRDSRTRLDLTYEDVVFVDMGELGIFALTTQTDQGNQWLLYGIIERY